MFRDVAPKSHNAIGFYKLNVLVLKNNIQCELYSKANFQFELLARIGFCCPKLKVLDIFGTDTWADCLVALFFRDAFHSLHRDELSLRQKTNLKILFKKLRLTSF